MKRLDVIVGLLLLFVTVTLGALSDSRCPVINFIRQPDCSRVTVINECSRREPCPPGKICCPGICGARSCVRVKPVACPLLACPPPPPDICPNGYDLDARGCQTCTCKRSPPRQCPPVPLYQPSECAAVLVLNECSVQRQNCPPGKMCCPGYCGASTCISKKPVACPLLSCPPPPPDICPNGYDLDARGCQTCTCKRSPPPQCPPIPAFEPIECAAVLVMNECSVQRQDCPPGKICCPGYCGATTCIKKKPICMPLQCARPRPGTCQFGFTTDSQGCPTCTCRKCPLIKCSRRCPQGYVKDRYGCNTCRCKRICPVLRCPAPPGGFCPFGYLQDANGCQTCTCKGGSNGQCPLVPLFPPPRCGSVPFFNECSVTARDCPPGKICCKGVCGGTECIRIKHVCLKRPCPRTCPMGFKKDKYGCPTCECNTICLPRPCPRPCPGGVKKDKYGCPTCECINVCLKRPCPRTCPMGFKKDKYGCPTCECNNLCPRIWCPRKCPMGYKKNKYGCPTCQCKTCPCGPKCCRLYCPWGYATDAFGCELCKCKCPPIKCSRRCPNGYIIDKDGCNTCRCKAPICPVPLCRNRCRFGYKLTRYGCQTCRCRVSRPVRLEYPVPSRYDDNYWSKLSRTKLVLETVIICSRAEMGNMFHAFVLLLVVLSVCVQTQGMSSMLRPSRQPVPRCVKKCTNVCQLGYKQDYKGCPTCACKKEVCKQTICSKACSQGYIKDDNGCETCVCKKTEKYPCRTVLCLKYCPNGYSRDANNCQICKCKLPRCPKTACKVHCPKGYVRDENGCQICKCKQPKCSRKVCRKSCPNGYKRDDDGCETCGCKYVKKRCAVIVCRKNCPGGYQLDANGCYACACNAAACSPVVCRYRCMSGHVNNSKGCPTCMCVQPRTCPIRYCPRVHCKDGRETDKWGCQTCRCRKSLRVSFYPRRHSMLLRHAFLLGSDDLLDALTDGTPFD
ncbi:cysteine-rich motor neuron 1 protein-like [Gigantopelta aegis]|uniref:cysteine-rich motor neuron 1 protein-like n=1 Tax=Gigantopelta aegis TaxID=1735272 RepID=UPI001B887AB2|nr:cysteine-rich motor neuron 1 protein-like [Gigantopelta aegis]